MIDIQVKLHDRYSVECKVGYHVDRDTEENEFRMNTWFFVPHSLDINASTYPKEAFYRDVKSNVRLITPIYRRLRVANGRLSFSWRMHSSIWWRMGRGMR